MKRFFWQNACQVEATKSIINTDVTIELKLFAWKSLFKDNNKINSSKTQVTLSMLLMLTFIKKISFIQHLYFGSNNEVIKTANKTSIMALIKRHGNCIVDHQFQILNQISQYQNQNISTRGFHKEKIWLWDLLIKVKIK